MKDNVALTWCEAATDLTGVSWRYLKVLQKDFENLQPDSFTELQLAIVRRRCLIDIKPVFYNA